MFIALVGPDGAGKTTVARALEAHAVTVGTDFAYQHWVPTASNRPRPSVPADGTIPPKRRPVAHPSKVDVARSLVRVLRNLVRFWVGYLLWIRPLRRRATTLVVADRWIYNYIGQPYSVAYYGPRWVARLAARAAPRPDVVVMLLAPGSVIAERKVELTAAEADLEVAAWSDISGSWWRGIPFDATRGPDTLAHDIFDRTLAACKVDGL